MKENDYTQEAAKSGIAIGSLALGAIAGAIAGILFAPKSGRETRDEIKDTLTKVKDDVAVRLSELKDITQETYHNVVDSVVQAYQDTRELTDEQATRIKSDLNEGYDDIKKATKNTINDVKSTM